MASTFFSVGLLLVAFFIQASSCAKVLLIPFNHRSHINIFGGLAEPLAAEGHEVWAIIEEKFGRQLEEKNIVTLTFHLPEKADFAINLAKVMENDPSGKTMLKTVEGQMYYEFGLYCKEVFQNKKIMETVKNHKFDLVVMDGLMAFSCMYTIPYKFDIPYITLHAFHTVSWTAGVTGMPSIEPDVLLEISNRMNFWERLANLKVWLAAMDEPVTATYDDYVLQTYAPEKPLKRFKDIVKDSEMFLMNYEIYCLDYPRVSAPNYQFLGPTTTSPAKRLPKDLEAFVEGAEHGVVVMTVGSFYAWQFIWKVIREKMFDAFGRLKQRVVVHYSLEDDPGIVPENVLLLKWVPQNDILGHPNTKLFITHGGNNGQNEGVYHGVPMIVMPISIDQRGAGLRTLVHGYGSYVKDLEAVTSNDILEMMQEILYNESYSANIGKCSKIVRSLPTAQETFVFWVNHILEFGGSHLRPPSLDMPLYKVLMLDIVAFYIVISLATLHACVLLVYCGCKYIVRMKKPKQE